MRSLVRIGGILLVIGMLVVVRKSLSEAKAPAAPKSRVAMVNLSQLLKGYTKSARADMENKKALVPLENEERKLHAKIEAHTKELENKELTDQKRHAVEKELTKSRRRLEDINNHAKIAAAKKTDKQMALLYKEVSEAAARYARQHDLDLILHYNDLPPNDPDHDKPANINRKILAGALIPLYMREGVDITDELIANLNDAYRAETKPTDKESP